jgi:8-oxo-dGTP pyrophosphatase MutT (NUDIX family)
MSNRPEYESDPAYLIPAAWTNYDVPYLPLPNRVELVLTDVEAPAGSTRTAFTVPIMEDGSLVMATNRRRGLEFSGGHMNPGENAQTAARRECFEETGCTVDELVPVGFLRMISDGIVPDGYRYPHPVGYQQFYAARVVSMAPYAANDECLAPTVLSPEEASRTLTDGRKIRYEDAVSVLDAFEAGKTPPSP